MNNSPTAENIDPSEPLWDLTADITIEPAALPSTALSLFEAADALKREVRCFEFVPSNYVNAWNCLAWLSTIIKNPSTPNPLCQTAWLRNLQTTPRGTPQRFCEWGSGMGVVAGLASLAGFESVGVELDERLSEQSRQLLTEQNIDTRIVCGSYFEVHEAADIYYVYAWPSQRSKIIDMFIGSAPSHALLLLCDGQDLLRIFTKWPRSDQARPSSQK